MPSHERQSNIVSDIATEELEKILFDTRAAFLTLNPEWRVVYVNAAAANLFNKQPAEILDRVLWALLPNLADSDLQREFRDCLRQYMHCNFEYSFPGDQHRYEIRAYPSGVGILLFIVDTALCKQTHQDLEKNNERLETLVRQRTNELEQTNVSLIEEIQNHLNTMRELSLLESITRGVSAARDIHAALIAILSSVCQETGWSLGQTWLPKAGHAGLEWCAPSYWRESGLEEFRSTSQHLCFIRDGDLPGRVWASGQTLKLSDLDADPYFMRKEAACQAGLRTAVAFPVLDGPEVVAVVEFFMREVGPNDDRYITQLTSIMAQIGPLVQRKRSEDALRYSEERFRLLVDGARDYAIFMVDPDGLIMSWNKGAERLKGYTSAEVIGQHFSMFYSSEDNSEELPHYVLEAAMRYGRFEAEGWRVRKDGSRFWANVIIRPLRDGHGRLVGYAKITHDLSERKEAHEQLQAYARQLHYLSQRLMQAQEAERRHLASELHDEIGQLLTVIKIGMQRLKEFSNAEDVNALFQDNIAAVDNALMRIRNMSLDLRPSVLDDFGLAAALRWYVERNSRSTGVKISLSTTSDVARLAPELETVCFRVAQEALTNTFRHARAKHAELTLQQDEGSLKLLIRDDGIGFDVSRLDSLDAHSQSFGLFSMRERVSLIGGHISIDSSHGRGTTICARFPRIPLPGGS